MFIFRDRRAEAEGMDPAAGLKSLPGQQGYVFLKLLKILIKKGRIKRTAHTQKDRFRATGFKAGKVFIRVK